MTVNICFSLKTFTLTLPPPTYTPHWSLPLLYTPTHTHTHIPIHLPTHTHMHSTHIPTPTHTKMYQFLEEDVSVLAVLHWTYFPTVIHHIRTQTIPSHITDIVWMIYIVIIQSGYINLILSTPAVLVYLSVHPSEILIYVFFLKDSRTVY